MKHFLYIISILLGLSDFLGLNLIAQPTPFQKLYFFSPFVAGSNKFVQTNFYEIENLSDGGFATLGFVTDTNNISQGVISRYDCLGNPLWTKLLGNSGSPTNTVMGITEGDSMDLVFTFPLATGFFQASTLIGRIDRNGQVKWMKKIGNNTEFGRDIVKTRDGGFVIAGSTGFYGSDFTADDVYLFKIDINGNVLWHKTFGNPSGTYDEAFGIKTDSQQNLIVTGRCIADGTFQAFILKTDSTGNPIKFKTYGFKNQRTYAFDVLVDKQDNYIITGSTTILEADFSSNEYDVFLIKVDSAMNTIYTNIYEVNTGADAGAIGESLCLGPDGKYIIGVSTFAFTTHGASGPNAPNKNAIYSINPDGSVNKAFIYNMKGSQYTRVRTTMDGFYLSAFSTAYANNVNFQGLIIKTDKNYISGCNDIEVTPELTLYQEPWTVDDFKYQSKSGTKSVNYTNYLDSAIQFSVLCETKIELNPKIEGPAMVCINEKFTIFDKSTYSDSAKHVWLFDGNPLSQVKGDQTISILNAGNHTITRILSYGCISKSTEIQIIANGSFVIINDSFCAGKPLIFNGDTFRNATSKRYTWKDHANCDSIIILNVKDATKINTESYTSEITCDAPEITIRGKKYNKVGVFTYDTIDQCDKTIFTITISKLEDCLRIPNVITPGDPKENNNFHPVRPENCKAEITEIDFKIYNRWGILVYESNDINEPGWNGLYKGNPAPADSYSYIINYKLRFSQQSNSCPYSHSGIFTLVR